MERVGGVELTDNVCRRLGPAVHEVATAARQQFEGVARAIRHKNAETPMCRTGEAFARLDAVVQEATTGGGLTPGERAAVDLIRWSWHEVTRELDALCDTLHSDTR